MQSKTLHFLAEKSNFQQLSFLTLSQDHPVNCNQIKFLFKIYLMKKSTAKTTVQPVTSTPPSSSTAFNAKIYIKDHVTEEDVNFAKESFDVFDLDHSGSIDTKELKAAMTSLGFQAKNAAIFQMISDLDTDGNGTIDFSQWLHLMTCKVNQRESRANIDKIFSLFDDEKTGYISLKNLRRVAEELGEKVSDEELDELIRRADLDNDGLVSAEEFYAIITKDTSK